MSTSRAILLIQALLVSFSYCQSPITVAPRAAGLPYSSCSDVIALCPFAQPECVQNYCSLACPDSHHCCSSSDSQGCLIDANLQSPCFNIENSAIFCPASVYLPSCLCYDTKGSYAPDAYDNMAQSCYAIATTASTGIVSYLTGSNGALGFCTKFAGPSASSASLSAASPSAKSTGPSQKSTSTPTTAKVTSQTSASTSPTAKSSASLMYSSRQPKSVMIAAAALVMLVI